MPTQAVSHSQNRAAGTIVDANYSHSQTAASGSYPQARRAIQDAARNAALEAYDDERLVQNLRRNLEEIAEQNAATLSNEDYQKLAHDYLEGRSAARREQALKEAMEAAKNLAERDFGRDPGAQPDTQAIKKLLSGIAERYGDVIDPAELHKSLAENFSETYQREFQKKCDTELNWVQRKWYGARRWFGGLLEGISNFAAGVKNAGSLLVQGISHVVDIAIDGAKSFAALAVTDPFAAGSKILGFAKSVSDSIGLTDVAVGVGRLLTLDFKGGIQALKGGATLFLEITGIADVWNAGKYALQGNWAMAGMHLAFAAASVGSIVATVATGGVAAGAIGLVMMGRMGMKSAAKLVMKTAAKEFFEKAGQKTGEQIAKRISASINQTALKQGAEEVADRAAHKLVTSIIGERGVLALSNPHQTAIVKEKLLDKLAKELSPEGLIKSGIKPACEFSQKMMRELKIAKQVNKMVDELLEKASCRGNIITRHVPDILGYRKRRFAAEISESFGVDSKHALKMAKDASRALRESYMRGRMPAISIFDPLGTVEAKVFQGKKAAAEEIARGDNLIGGILSRNITDSLQKHFDDVIQDSVSKRYQKILAGEIPGESAQAMARGVRRQADMLGKEHSKLVDEYVQAGTKGFQQGFRQGIHEAVEKGVGKGMKAFRRGMMKKAALAAIAAVRSDGEAPEIDPHAGDLDANSRGVGLDSHEIKAACADAQQAATLREIKTAVRSVGDDKVQDVYERLDDGQWRLIATNQLATDKFQDASMATGKKIEREEIQRALLQGAAKA